MTLSGCPREREVLDLLARGHWPQACSTDLRAHVDDCRSCAEQILLTEAFQHARAEASSAANLTSPAVLWWRAQLRRRNEAVERVGRPILGAQIFTRTDGVALDTFFVNDSRTGSLGAREQHEKKEHDDQ